MQVDLTIVIIRIEDNVLPNAYTDPWKHGQ